MMTLKCDNIDYMLTISGILDKIAAIQAGIISIYTELIFGCFKSYKREVWLIRHTQTRGSRRFQQWP